MTSHQEPLPVPTLPFSAVFVDLENMAIKPDPDHPVFDLALVMKQVRFLSNPIVRMGFADWSKLPQFTRSFVLQGFDQIQVTYVSGSKNSADMQLCVDALEVVLLRKEIQTVVLVSGDADFTPLARAVRRQGRQVIGIGWRDKVSLVFRRSCDRFFAYEELPGLSIDEATELSMADRRAERRLASQQARRSVSVFRPGARTSGKTRRRSARAEDEESGTFLQDPRDVEAPATAEPAPERREVPEQPEKLESDAGQPDDPIAKLRSPPIGFLGGDRQFAVLEALHRELSEQAAPRRRNQIVNAVAQQLAPMRRAQVAAVERILWHAKVYDVVDRAGQRSSVLWNVQLRAKNRDFDALRAAHDIQLIADAADAGLFLTAAEWSEQFYGGPEDADVIDEYFREAAGISNTFARETGIAPPDRDDGEVAAEAAEETAGDQPTDGDEPHDDGDPTAVPDSPADDQPPDEAPVETLDGGGGAEAGADQADGPTEAETELRAEADGQADHDDASIDLDTDESGRTVAANEQTDAAVPEDDGQPAPDGDTDEPSPDASPAEADSDGPATRTGWWSRL